MVTHVLKDGTITKDISGVTVPREITERLVDIARNARKEKQNEKSKQNVGTRNDGKSLKEG